MPKDDHVIIEKEISSRDLLKRLYNQAERGPSKRVLISAAAKKRKIQQEKEIRSKREKEMREFRLSQGLCTRCGVMKSPEEDHRLCLVCRRKNRKGI